MFVGGNCVGLSGPNELYSVDVLVVVLMNKVSTPLRSSDVSQQILEVRNNCSVFFRILHSDTRFTTGIGVNDYVETLDCGPYRIGGLVIIR